MTDIHLEKFVRDGYLKIKNAVDKKFIKEIECEILSSLTKKKVKSSANTLNTLSNQARQSENQRYSRDTSVFNDFNEQIAKSMTNDNLATIEGRVDRYINDYGHRMSDLGAENFTILKEPSPFANLILPVSVRTASRIMSPELSRNAIVL